MLITLTICRLSASSGTFCSVCECVCECALQATLQIHNTLVPLVPELQCVLTGLDAQKIIAYIVVSWGKQVCCCSISTLIINANFGLFFFLLLFEAQTVS